TAVCPVKSAASVMSYPPRVGSMPHLPMPEWWPHSHLPRVVAGCTLPAGSTTTGHHSREVGMRDGPIRRGTDGAPRDQPFRVKFLYLPMLSSVISLQSNACFS